MVTDEIVDHTSDLIVRVPHSSALLTLIPPQTNAMVISTRHLMPQNPENTANKSQPPTTQTSGKKKYVNLSQSVLSLTYCFKELRRQRKLKQNNQQLSTTLQGLRVQSKHKQMLQKMVPKNLDSFLHQPRLLHQRRPLSHLLKYMRGVIALTFPSRLASYHWMLLYSIVSAQQGMIVSANICKQYY